MKKALVTGGSGFIGSNLVEKLLKQNFKVLVYDIGNKNTKKNCMKLFANINFVLICGDILHKNSIYYIMKSFCPDVVFHLAANADVRYGFDRPLVDLNQNVIGTVNVLEAMRLLNIKKIVFSSTASVYGEVKTPIHELSQFPISSSTYADSKLAAEAFIQAYCEGYGFQSWIFRLVSILGKNYSHGHVIDFYNQLKLHPEYLEILGNGQQIKSYLDVEDCINGIMIGYHNSNEKINIFNLGSDESITVFKSAKYITDSMNINNCCFKTVGHENKGWKGDVSKIILSSIKLKDLGWKPKHSIKEAVERTVSFLKENDNDNSAKSS